MAKKTLTEEKFAEYSKGHKTTFTVKNSKIIYTVNGEEWEKKDGKFTYVGKKKVIKELTGVPKTLRRFKWS